MKKTLLSCLFAAFAMLGYAQSGTNSPYSGYGLGVLGDQSTGISRGMNGVGIGFRESGQVNYLNPASYSSIDSLTFVFDVAMTLQNSNFSENGNSRNAKNADFEYAVGAFRLIKHVGMAFGLMPYSNVGYNFSSASKKINGYTMLPSAQETTMLTNTYSGSGGLHEFFIGAGWEPVKNLSVGANVGYLWGTCSNAVINAYTDAYVKTLTRLYDTKVNTVKVDLGASYTLRLAKKDYLTVAATYSPGLRTNSSPTCLAITTNSQSAVNDSTEYVAKDAIRIPTQIGFGLGYKHGTKWLVGLDYTYQDWSATKGVYYEDGKGTKLGDTDSYYDRHKVNVGAQYCVNPEGRTVGDRMRYRVGASYTSPYLIINDKKGPREISVSAGVGIPIINNYNTRSMVNVSLQWSNSVADGLVRDNSFRINVGITFNERWFAKWKFE